VRLWFRSSVDTSELLDRFCCLQDQVSRLVESASDAREETFDVLKRKHPDLIRDIIELVSFTEKVHLNNASAVSHACSAISRSLARLEYLGHHSNVVATDP
jgi:hypothetical protein